jgi:hypothetical protein
MTAAQNGGKVVSLTHRPPLLPGNTPGTHSATGRIMLLKNSNENIGNRTRDLPVCSVVLLPLRHRAPSVKVCQLFNHTEDSMYCEQKPFRLIRHETEIFYLSHSHNLL